MEELQNQASTLRKLNRPSDNPVGSSKVLEVRTDKVNNTQFQTNAKMAESFLNNTDHVLEELSEVAMRAKEIAIQQASGASATAETRLGVAEEVQQLLARSIAVANTKIGDRYLLGGYRTEQPPVDESGHYQGDRGEMMIEIAKDVFLTMNLPGIDALNTKPDQSGDFRRVNPNPQENPDTNQDQPEMVNRQLASSSGVGNVNLFQELGNLRIGLLTNDVRQIQETLDRLGDIRDHLVSQRTKIGSRVASLQSTIQNLERQDITNAALASNFEDADMVEVMNNMAREESILRSVLSGSQRLVQPTLMDFLK